MIEEDKHMTATMEKSNIEVHPALSTQPTRPKSPALREALHRKRESLDQDIAEFKRLKEEEYRRYESELRSLVHGQILRSESQRDTEIQSSSPSLCDNAQTATRRLLDEPVHLPGASEPRRNEPSRSIPNGIDTADGQESQVISQPQAFTSADTKANIHDKEHDFRGLFLPNYLPLLDSPPHPNPPSTSSQPLLAPLPTKTPLSSSATLPAIAFDPLRSPPQRPKLSNSVPRPKTLQARRRSSSRSDTSLTSLRSSLRRPKSPRSSKHVLFSINDLVLSPSSSPVTRRTVVPSAVEASGLRDGKEDAGVVGAGLEMEKLAGAQLDDLEPTAENAVSLLAGPSSPTMSSTYQSFFEPTFVEQSPVRNEFESGNALFAFDEDADFMGDVDLDEDKDDFGLDAEDGKADDVPLSTSSTVGSLPIEIKWPARRDPRG